jgi:hypothetical protein
LSDVPPAVGFEVVTTAGIRSEVADPGLAGRPAAVEADIGLGVINIDTATDRSRVGKHIGRVPQQDLLTQTGRNLVAVDRIVTGRQVNHRFQVDRAPVPEHSAQLAEQYRPHLFNPGHPASGAQRLLTEMDIDDDPGPGPLWVERRRGDRA